MNKEKLLVLTSIILSTVLVSFYGGNITYSLFYLSLIIPITCILYTLYISVRIKLYQVVESHQVVKGELNPYNFTLSNEDFIAYSCIKVNYIRGYSTILNVNEQEEYRLLPGESVKKNQYVCCNYRGEYEVGVDSIEVTDFLSLFTIRYKVHSNLNIRVLPRIVSLEENEQIASNMDMKKVLDAIYHGESILDTDTRPYIRGDTIRQIHWKASSRENKLVSRKIMNQEKDSIYLCMDLAWIEADDKRMLYEDQVLELALSFAEYGLKNKVDTLLNYDCIGVKRMRVYNSASLENFYQICCSLNFRGKSSMKELLEEAYNSSYSTIIYITHQLHDSDYASLYELKELACHIIVLYISLDNSFMEIERKELSKMGIVFQALIMKELGGNKKNDR